jgi:hypothetical protein
MINMSHVVAKLVEALKYRLRKTVSSIPDEAIECFQFTQSFQPRHGPPVYTASNRNTWNFLGGLKRGRRVRAIILPPPVAAKCGSLDVSYTYGPPRPVRGLASHFFKMIKKKVLKINKNKNSKHTSWS